MTLKIIAMFYYPLGKLTSTFYILTQECSVKTGFSPMDSFFNLVTYYFNFGFRYTLSEAAWSNIHDQIKPDQPLTGASTYIKGCQCYFIYSLNFKYLIQQWIKPLFIHQTNVFPKQNTNYRYYHTWIHTMHKCICLGSHSYSTFLPRQEKIVKTKAKRS